MARSKKGKSKRKSIRDKVREKSQQTRQGSIFNSFKTPDGFEVLKVKKAGAMRMDILPYDVKTEGNPSADVDDLYFERTYWLHKNLGEGDNKRNVICLQKNFNKPCPVCEQLKKNKEDESMSDEECKAEWSQIGAKERQLFNVRDLSDPDTKFLFDCSVHLFGDLLNTRVKDKDEDEDFDCFADVEGGKTLKISWKEKTFGKATYYEAASIDFKDRKEDYTDEDIDGCADLDDLLIELSYDEIYNILNCIDGDEQQPEKPKKDKKAKKNKKAEEEPEKEEKPKKEKKAKKDKKSKKKVK